MKKLEMLLRRPEFVDERLQIESRFGASEP
jgi:hypothetical protein